MDEVWEPDSLDLNVQRKRKVLSPERLKAKKALRQHPPMKLQKTKGHITLSIFAELCVPT